MWYQVSLLGVLVTLINVIFIVNKLLVTHFTVVIIHEHILKSLLENICESCLTSYIWKDCLLQTQNTKSMAICNISLHI